MTAARDIAMEVLRRIEEDGAYSHLALNHALDDSVDSKERGFATQIVYGTLSWRSALDRLIAQKSKRSLHQLDPVVLRTLRVATYQLVFLRVPDHAALDQAVRYVKRHIPAASGYVNGVLRSITRDKEHVWWSDEDRTKKPVRYLAQRYAMPKWIANRISQTLDAESAEACLNSMTESPRTWVRAREEFEVPEGWEPGSIPGAWNPPNVGAARPYLEANQVAVQDLGAQLAVHACGDVSGKSVLDLCAGLGGKSLAFADRGATVTAVEPHGRRLNLMEHPSVTKIASTAQEFAFKNEQQFDVVFVDAPCSGLGVIRRHPETKWSKKEPDVMSLASLQSTILNAAAGLTKPGGLLVYCVCTFTREETTRQIERFDHPDFELEGFDDGFAVPTGQIQLWPHTDGTDGFFVARLRRNHA